MSLSFYIAFATAIFAPWSARLRLAFELVLPYVLFCLTMDLCNALIGIVRGIQLPLQAMSIVGGLIGFLFFSLTVLSYADMPELNSGPTRSRFQLSSLPIVLTAITGSAVISMWLLQYELGLVNRLRDVALLWGVSVGLFLFVPLIFVVLNLLASFQNLLRTRRHYAPDITVIIPARNESHGIAACIAAADNAAGNNDGSVTLIVVDNSSTDNTPRSPPELSQTANIASGGCCTSPRPVRPAR